MKGCVMRAEGLPQLHGTVRCLTFWLLLLLSHAYLLTASAFSRNVTLRHVMLPQHICEWVASMQAELEGRLDLRLMCSV